MNLKVKDMKRFLKITTAIAMMAMAWACNRDAAVNDITQDGDKIEVADGSLVKVSFSVKIPDPIKVATRAVDPDGNGIQTMTLFCFDGEGLLISTATATLVPSDDESGGILDADIPNTTRVIHLLANQNMAQFKEDEFRNMSEDQVIANLEGSSGMMIYWARVEIPANVVGGAGILEWITVMTNPTNEKYNNLDGANQPIIMLRNQAKVMVDAGGTDEDVEKDWSGNLFEVTGFTVVNTQAFGTVAPYHTTYGYPTYACTNSQKSDYTFEPEFGLVSGTVADWATSNYVNLPSRSDKLSNITDVSTEAQTYVFETENSSADPVSVIIKGQNKINGVLQPVKYYRVTLTNSDGNQVLLRRNHLYTINIKGNLQYGVDSFGAALDAPASNNVWLSISDEVKSVQDAAFKLSVKETSVVLDNQQLAEMTSSTTPATLQLDFSVEQLSDSDINLDDLQVSWVDSRQNVSSTYNFAKSSNSTSSVVYFPALAASASQKGTVVNGTITISLIGFSGINLNEDILEGTLLVKYGRLQRKIKVVCIRLQKFTPTWVTAQVYSSTSTPQSNATLLFTIPDDCPSVMFPMNVLISTNDLDVRSETGQVLPIIRSGEEGYGAENGIGYKYVYEVKEPGEQFVYMKSILTQDDGSNSDITIEAEHFESVTKHVIYTDEVFGITVTNVDSSTDLSADAIYYQYLPQKKNAPFAINLNMKKLSDNTDKVVGKWDEFMLYSENLDAYLDSEVEVAKALLPNDSWLGAREKPNLYFPCQFISYGSDIWDTGGRVFAFMPRPTYFNSFTTADSENTKARFSIYMKTNKAKSAELIRISSNVLGAKAAFTTETEGENITNSTVYKINQADDYLYSSSKGSVSTYRSMIFELRNYPAFRFAAQVNGKPSYPSSPNLTDDEEEVTPIQISYEPGTTIDVEFDITQFTAANGVVVDPFGSEFDVYIQTPNLALQTGQSNQIEKLDNTGLYVYHVNQDRSAEAAGWNTTSLQSSVNGERKVITFVTKRDAIVTEGNIEIYTDIEEVGYKSKTFAVSNEQISGTITYGDNIALPKNTFVSFSRELDGSRIGSMTVTADGSYQLRLRKEYEFTWDQNDPVKLYARVGGKYYFATYENLAALYASPNVVLIEESKE